MSFKFLLILFFVGTQTWGYAFPNNQKTLDSSPIFVKVREEITSRLDATVLTCNYQVCSGPEMPVEITWKIGTDPETAETIATSNYDPNTGEASSFKSDYMPIFSGRLKLGEGTAEAPPALTIYPVNAETDNQNVWCEVQNHQSNEIGTDIKSTVLRVKGSENERPKFNIVSLPKLIVDGFSRNSITLECSCEGSHCEDVSWYKGPYDKAGTVFEKIYDKETLNRPMEPVITYGPEWKERISVSGYSLTIHELTVTDAGRYWCMAKGADFYSLGDAGTDAKSLILTVDEPGTYAC